MKRSRILGDLLARRDVPLLVAGVALLLTLPALWVGWQLDDEIHRYALLGSPHMPEFAGSAADLFAPVDGDPERNFRLMDRGVLPWWTYEKLRLAFWRPLAAFTHWLDYQLWPNSAFLMHAHSLVWFGAAIVLAGVLYRRLMGASWVAGLAALFYAIDDAHGLPAGWIANRNALIAIVFGLLALLAHDRWRRDGWRAGAALGPMALLLALLAAESAIGTVAYLLAHAVFLDAGTRRRRFLALLPHALVAIGWLLAYDRLGYGAAGSDSYVYPAREPLRFGLAALARIPLLLFGQWGFLPADIGLIMSTPAQRVFWLGALVYLALLIVAIAPLLRRNKQARFFATGMLLSLLPICAVFPSDRLLFFVGFGAMGLLAQFLGALREQAARLANRRRRWAIRGLAAALVGIHGVLAPLSLPARTGSPLLLGAGVARLADSFPDNPSVAGRSLIIVNPPGMFVGAFLPIRRALNDQQIPAHTRILAPGTQPLELTRIDERTLAVRPALGYLPRPGTPAGRHSFWAKHFNFGYMHQHLDRLYRDERHPLVMGQRIELTGVTVEVTALTEDGRPAEATFRFAMPLEHPSLRWVRCEAGVYVPFTPPAAGEMVRLEPVTLPGGE